MKDLELRMYGLVPYNISPIQQAIQFGHAVVEYGQKMKRLGEHKQSLNLQYDDWADNWKTFIILNGGTTNHKTDSDGVPFGSLNQHVLTLQQNGIEFATFNEPDLGDQLTAVVFIIDERVFNRKKYPDFEDWIIENHPLFFVGGESGAYKIASNIKTSELPEHKELYQKWVDLIGGEKNVFLRDFLHPKNFKLA